MYYLPRAKRRFGYDDALDAFGCHCVGGIVGGILTGLFCVPGLSWTEHGGLLYTGDWSLLGAQVLGILVTIAFVAIADVVLGLIIKACFAGSLRVRAPRMRRLALDVGRPWRVGLPSLPGSDQHGGAIEKGVAAMKRVTAIVRPEKMEPLKDALFAADVKGMTISQVHGCGAQHGWSEYVRGTEVMLNMVPKVKFEVVVEDDAVDALVDTIGRRLHRRGGRRQDLRGVCGGSGAHPHRRARRDGGVGHTRYNLA